ncbi:MAG TPA: molybdopterin molybdenumtransferase MoeA [Peptococcaceae bacterium]|nr:MAG: Molybdopterin molybdochelatase [Moorella sp. 60_41]HBT47755.1 molybdopterin molybdenumtransferase MoeA [Peptococcaceae bacterium]
MEFFQVVTLPEARKKLAECWPSMRREAAVLDLTEALGRELAEDVISREEVPGFSRATVDGFAVRSGDTFGAGEASPVTLRLKGEVVTGRPAEVAVGHREAVAISTGGMLPAGADAVIMLEHTEELPGGFLNVLRPVAPGENVMGRGEDVGQGEVILGAGHRLRPQDIGVLAALGYNRIRVWEPWRVGIMTTGNEIVPPEARPGPGQVRDINSYTLYAQVQALGGRPRLYGIVPDDLRLLGERFSQALEENNVVLLSGGSSVGTRDLTVQLLAAWGSERILFHGVSIRPGKPTLAAFIEGKMVFGLPGHPVSAMVSFDLLVGPLLRYGRYKEPAEEPVVEAVLSRNVSSDAGRDDYVRVRLVDGGGDGLLAVPIVGKSGLISTMVKADGVVIIPAGKEGLEAGNRVEVRLFD